LLRFHSIKIINNTVWTEYNKYLVTNALSFMTERMSV